MIIWRKKIIKIHFLRMNIWDTASPNWYLKLNIPTELTTKFKLLKEFVFDSQSIPFLE